MSAVLLVSGGLDSSLMALLAREESVEQFPLFIDYGQRGARREWEACKRVFKNQQLPQPQRLAIPGFGVTIKSGLTDRNLDVVRDAFLPTRNLMFLVCGAAYAYQRKADTVLIGLLNEATHIFPDQTGEFLRKAEAAVSQTLGRSLKVLAPLSHLRKQEVVALAERHRLRGTYSCHKGTVRPCGRCIACREFDFRD
jgi:7-cyano-7-deazaguanine synthase